MSAGASPFSNTRIMSLSANEFAASIARLGACRTSYTGDKVFTLPSGTVEITFQEIPGVRLGGLLALPRAKVALKFSSSITPADRTAFVHRFDIAFQRGGG